METFAEMMRRYTNWLIAAGPRILDQFKAEFEAHR